MRILFSFLLVFLLTSNLHAQTWKVYSLANDKLSGAISFPGDVLKKVSTEGDLAVYSYTCNSGNDVYSLTVKVAKGDFPAGTAEQKFREEIKGSSVLLPDNTAFEGSESYSGLYNSGNSKVHVVVAKNVLYIVKYEARMTYSSKVSSSFFGSFTTKNAKQSINNSNSNN
jgi:uncharacterized protein YaiE (UPF0345 family)